MRLSQILMQHDAMHDGQTSIHSIHQEEDKPCDVTSLDDDIAQQEEHDKGDTDGAHIARKTFCLPFRTEIEYTEHHRSQDRSYYQALLHIRPAPVYQCDRYQYCQRITRCDTIDAIHEIDDIGSSHIYDEGNQDYPPHRQVQDTKLIES